MRRALIVTQVVGDVARGDDEETALGQRRQRLAEAEGQFRAAVALDRQRHDRHFGVGEHQAQRHPGAVVEAALVVAGDRQAGGGDRPHHLVGGFAAAGGRVADGVEFIRKAGEVVDRPRTVGKADGRDGGVPVCADDDDGARRRQFARRGGERGAGGTGAQREGRRAVGNEEDGLGVWHGNLSGGDGRTVPILCATK